MNTLQGLLLGLLVLLMTSCVKESVNIDLENQNLIENLVADKEFVNFVNIDEQLINHTKAIDENAVKTFESLVSSNSSKAYTEQEFVLILSSMGLSEAKIIVNLLSQKYAMAERIFKNRKDLAAFPETRRSQILKSAILEVRTSPNLNSVLADECSDAYAASINSCENVYALELGLIAAATVFATLTTSPAGGAAVFFPSSIAASAHLLVCRQGAVGAWRVCRDYHPI